MGKTAYIEKLKDPRWQKKRLEILQRDSWTCRSCGDKTNTLHVHHIFYLPRMEPWDVPDGFLITLCEGCHEGICDSGPCESCEYFSLNCEGPGDIPADLIKIIGIVLDAIWKKQTKHNDYLDALRGAYDAIEAYSEL
jgi:hypothetical protein